MTHLNKVQFLAGLAALAAFGTTQFTAAGIPAFTAGNDSAHVFAPGVISDSNEQWRITFTPDGKTAYFAESEGFFPVTRKATIYVSRLERGSWTSPAVAPFSGSYPDMDPFITPNGRRLYFSSIRPIDGAVRGDIDLFYVEQTDAGWGEPVRLDGSVNTPDDELYPSTSGDGTLYFASGPLFPQAGKHFDIFRAKAAAAGFQPREALGPTVNTAPAPGDPSLQSAWDFNPEISTDGRTLVFTSLRPGRGLGDLYISRLQGGEWATARALGPEINTSADEYHPTLSRDGRELFFVRRGPARGDFYVISTRSLGMGQLESESCDSSLGPTARCGTFETAEDRDKPLGRQVRLRFVILPATGTSRAADPIFFVNGGPGQTAIEQAPFLARSPLRVDRDIVIVDQRGTSAAPRLDCQVPARDANPQVYLAPLFDVASFTACRDSLQRIADLTKYSTLDAVADFEEIRAALGYDRINLLGASYGTRVILQYLRQSPSHVRSAVMTSATPPAFRNPLYHARSAQDALDSLFAACAADQSCHSTFPSPAEDLTAVLSRLTRSPASVDVAGPGGSTMTVRLSRDAFAEALRVMMYVPDNAAKVPLLIRRAAEGEYAPFAAQAITSNRNLRSQLRMGMLMSVLCSEDAPRISESDIVANTRGTFLGDARVRQQLAACAVWPRADIPRTYSMNVVSGIPAIVISGRQDPVVPPRWGDTTVRGLSAGRHIVVEGGHSPINPCLTAVAAEFLRTADAKGLDLACVSSLRRPAFTQGPPG